MGAGDTTLSGLALGLAAGYSGGEAAEFANFAAAVTVQKLFQTGTASGGEVLEIGRDADYIYQPELAEEGLAIAVLNTTLHRGLGARVARKIRNMGGDVVSVSDASYTTLKG